MLDSSLSFIPHIESISKSIRLLPSKIYPKSNQFLPSPLVQAIIYCLNFGTAFQLVCPQWTLVPFSSFSTHQPVVIFKNGLWNYIIPLLKPSRCFPLPSECKHTLCAKAYRSFMIWILLPHFLSWISHTGQLSLKPNSTQSLSPPHSLCTCSSFYLEFFSVLTQLPLGCQPWLRSNANASGRSSLITQAKAVLYPRYFQKSHSVSLVFLFLRTFITT